MNFLLKVCILIYVAASVVLAVMWELASAIWSVLITGKERVL
jgi:hypothetical protein